MYSYAGFVDTTVYVYCSEIFPTHIRAKGMGWSIAIFFLSTLSFLESSATGFATIGWKYYLLFVILPSINVVLLWIFCPEVCLRCVPHPRALGLAFTCLKVRPVR